MEKVNIAELIKDCPKGMKLYCTMYEDVYFDYVDELNIIHCYIQYETHKTSITFNQHGTPNSNIKSKCVIFPKGKTTWKGFQKPFVDGEVLSYQFPGFENRSIYIYRNHPAMNTSYYVALSGDSDFMVSYGEGCALNGNNDTARIATEEEKEKLFQAIKYHGYKWNPETKTLDKLPKFKVGDKIRFKNDKTVITITGIKDDYYLIQYYNTSKCNYQNEKISFKIQDKYELVPSKFDINTLIPFESKVLVRGDKASYWKPAIFGCYMEHMTIPYYVLGGNCWNQCIPYEGNQHLLKTNKDCDEYFKTWDE